MNLISETHHSCERREYVFMVLREYTIIFHTYFVKYFGLVSCIDWAWAIIYIYLYIYIFLIYNSIVLSNILGQCLALIGHELCVYNFLYIYIFLKYNSITYMFYEIFLVIVLHLLDHGLCTCVYIYIYIYLFFLEFNSIKKKRGLR